jgi:ATP-dependent Clp protease protease subunit
MSGLGIDEYIQHNVTSMTPNVVEERQMRATVIDVFSRLMADRIIFLGSGVDDYVANVVVAQLLFLESVDAKKDILLYINSPGGSVYAGLGIYDTMQYVRPDVATICTSLAASMGAVLLCGGAAGKRSSLPHARIMIHQPSGGAQGQSSDIEITAKQILILRKELYEIISHHSGQPFEKIEKDSDRDYWMKAEEAKEYGLIDEVLVRS